MFFRKRSRKFRLIALGLVMTAVGVSAWIIRRHPDNTLPLEDVVDRSVLAAPGSVNLVVVDRRTVVNKEGKQHCLVTLALANDGDRTIEYFGNPPFGETHVTENGFIQPMSDTEIPQGNGWVKPPGWRCAHGCRTLTVRPGQAARFEERFWGESPTFRVTLKYKEAGGPDRPFDRTVASLAIHARGGETSQIADLKPISQRSLFWAVVSKIRRMI